MSSASWLPLFLRLRDQPCLVVGGGAVAARKVDALLASGARVTVVAPVLGEALRGLREAGRITHHARAFVASDVDGQVFIVSATERPEVNRQVAAAGAAAARLVNVVDDLEACGAIFPSLVRRGELTVAISTGGAAPVLARQVRARLEAMLAPSLGDLVALAARWRQRVQQRLGSFGARRRLWERVLDERGAVLQAFTAGRPDVAEATLQAALEEACAAQSTAARARGFVSLVGAGPGDPELLTLRALRTLQDADVVLHDRLVSPEILELARRDATREDVGKLTGGDHAAAQEAINERLVELADAGLRVVRLKGGDPFIFGRGAEELAALRAHGIPFEIVPGITAALGCAAYAGVPLTRRAVAQQVTLVTAHCERSMDRLDWPVLAQARHTAVFYMGVGHAALIEARLLAGGRDGATPVAIIERGTTARQRVLHTSLRGLADTVCTRQVRAPALIVVGEVAAADAAFAWFGAADAHAPVPGDARALDVAA